MKNNQTTTETKIMEILYRHRANDRGNANLNLFDDHEKLSEQDIFYADKIMQLIAKEKTALLDGINEEVCLAFIRVAGIVLGIEMGRRGWADKDMKLFNNSILKTRDMLIDKLQSLAHSQEDREGK